MELPQTSWTNFYSSPEAEHIASFFSKKSKGWGNFVGRRNQYFYLATLMCFLIEEIEESSDNIIIIQFVKT